MGLADSLRSRVAEMVLVAFLLLVLVATIKILLSASTTPQPTLRSPAAHVSATATTSPAPSAAP